MMGLSVAFGSALFVVVAMSLAGVVHVLWLRSATSKYFCQPLDGGLTFRGRRLFGANKTLRGLMVMPIAAAVTFSAAGSAREWLPGWIAAGMWDLALGEYALLGLACGSAFMIFELPNSFLKRQLDVPPGEAPRQPWLRAICFSLDRCDSTVGVMLVVAVALPISGETWFWVFLLGPASHAVFSALLHQMGEKARVL
jgi:CDP-2,3-bis-(O-geranylgeranyl)-sn-glycerol synthase